MSDDIPVENDLHIVPGVLQRVGAGSEEIEIGSRNIRQNTANKLGMTNVLRTSIPRGNDRCRGSGAYRRRSFPSRQHTPANQRPKSFTKDDGPSASGQEAPSGCPRSRQRSGFNAERAAPANGGFISTLDRIYGEDLASSRQARQSRKFPVKSGLRLALKEGRANTWSWLSNQLLWRRSLCGRHGW